MKPTGSGNPPRTRPMTGRQQLEAAAAARKAGNVHNGATGLPRGGFSNPAATRAALQQMLGRQPAATPAPAVSKPMTAKPAPAGTQSMRPPAGQPMPQKQGSMPRPTQQQQGPMPTVRPPSRPIR